MSLFILLIKLLRAENLFCQKNIYLCLPFLKFMDLLTICRMKCQIYNVQYLSFHFRGVVPGGAGDVRGPPDFGRSVNPISTRSSRLQLPRTPWFSDVPTALPSTNSSSIVVELRRRYGWSLQATKQASQASLYRLLRAHSLTHPPHLESLSALHTELHAVWDSAHEILPALFETTIYTSSPLGSRFGTHCNSSTT